MSYLLRESYREDGKVKHRTIANLSRMPKALIDQIEQLLQGAKPVKFDDKDMIRQEQGKAYGALKVIFEIAKRLGIEKASGNRRGQPLTLNFKVVKHCGYWGWHIIFEFII